ncbi:hypothetical protein D3C87_1504800 [compost metagenome]
MTPGKPGAREHRRIDRIALHPLDVEGCGGCDLGGIRVDQGHGLSGLAELLSEFAGDLVAPHDDDFLRHDVQAGGHPPRPTPFD